ncbi:MAG: hypothetical protein IIZ73_03045 [Ruminococcus sp.]|nr:hypothetical protein [Ruminococcus sp.]MCR5142037.1 hypothetical protein [Ruminococcus sp.]
MELLLIKIGTVNPSWVKASIDKISPYRKNPANADFKFPDGERSEPKGMSEFARRAN